MNRTPDSPLARPAFFDGQSLSASDLDAAQTYHRRMRWMHNRCLHGWGIVAGMAVTGRAGARSVQVQPGYALDALGREILLFAPQELPVPASAGSSDGSPARYLLTASYADDAYLAAETMAGTCGTAGAVRRLEAPTLRWQDPADSQPSSRYRYGTDIVLAEAGVQNCRLARDVSGEMRRDALPPQQPYVAAGRTPAGSTRWRPWPTEAAAFGVASFVSTVEAGFRVTPRYQAHVEGERLSAAGLVDGCTHIALATATGFELRMILPSGVAAGSGQVRTFTLDDYTAVVKPFADNFLPFMSLSQAVASLLQLNGTRVSVGQHLLIDSVLGPIVPAPNPVVRANFEPHLAKIAADNGVTLAQLVAANRWDLDTFSIALDDRIAIPGPALALNPPAVLKPEFMATLSEQLAWHVAWLGVEG